MNKETPTRMDPTALYYTLSTTGQCAAALAALIGFLGLWKLDGLRREQEQVEGDLRRLVASAGNPGHQARTARMELPFEEILSTADTIMAYDPSTAAHRQPQWEQFQPRVISKQQRWEALPSEQGQLMDALVDFLLGTLAVLVLAIGLLPFAEALSTWVWPMRVVIIVMSLWLGCAPAYVVVQATGGKPVWQRHWSRRADQMRQAWNRTRQWHGLAPGAAGLRGQWFHIRQYWRERGWPTLQRWGTQARTRIRRS